jgi:cytidine deaminase
MKNAGLLEIKFMNEGQKEQARQAARAVAVNAWCRYSKFRVGAALVTKNGTVVSGCNVENASSGLTICAERNAVASAVASGQTEFELLVVYTPTETPTTPCGACRQVIAEFGMTLEIECICDGDDVIKTSIEELLPHRFGPESLALDG